MKKLIVNTIIPIALLISAIFIIGAGCSPGLAVNLENSVWFKDADGDGYGLTGNSILQNEQPEGYVLDDTDCDDTNADVYPDAAEIPDNDIDEDCNGKFAYSFYVDKDGDGFGSDTKIVIEIDNNTNAPDNYSWFAGDCNDDNSEIHPKAVEIPKNGIDDNCDGITDIVEYYIDEDGDGYGSEKFSPTEGVTNNLDCDDSNAEIHPYTREILNDKIDSNCNGEDNT